MKEKNHTSNPQYPPSLSGKQFITYNSGKSFAMKFPQTWRIIPVKRTVKYQHSRETTTAQRGFSTSIVSFIHSSHSQLNSRNTEVHGNDNWINSHRLMLNCIFREKRENEERNCRAYVPGDGRTQIGPKTSKYTHFLWENKNRREELFLHLPQQQNCHSIRNFLRKFCQRCHNLSLKFH